MSEHWSKIGEKILSFLVWSIDSHPGKFIGTSLGLVLGLLIVTLGFWSTLVLALFAIVGFVLGKSEDDAKSMTTWYERTIKKY